jgi:ATP-binding protein involved in chromosome partitioning
MSIIYFVGDKPAPLRGSDTSYALIELLAITQWGELDFLVLDMPPGIGDAVLDMVRLINRIEFLIVTTPSLLAFQTVKKQVSLLSELKMPIVGIIENMKMDKANDVKLETEKLGLKYLGVISFDTRVEAAIGNGAKLLNTAIGKKIKQVVDKEIITPKRAE